MRNEASFRGMDFDTPNDFHLLPSGSLEYVSSRFLFETCRRHKYEIFSDPGRFMHQLGYDFAACAQDQVECKKASVKCLGTCGGTSGSQYKHDFSSIVSLTELGQFALGDGFDDAAAADCNVRSYVFKVPTFEGGDSFLTVAARARVRSGMTAIDNDFCFKNARSCGVIQDVLERSPGLVFVNGEFRHKMDLVPPSPPPSPSPPPRLFAYAPEPPSPPPPPGTPPPYYKVTHLLPRTHTTPCVTELLHACDDGRTPRTASRCRASPTTGWTSASRPSTAPRRRSARAASLCGGSWTRSGARRRALRASPTRTRRRRRRRT